MEELTIKKEYKTIAGFVKGCRAALIKVFGDDDDLTTIVSLGGDGIITYLLHGGKEYADVLTGTGKLSMSEGGDDWKRGFDFRFDDGFIYVYNIE